jgi:hypothetical protein
MARLLLLRRLVDEMLVMEDVSDVRELTVLTVLRGDHAAGWLVDSAIKPKEHGREKTIAENTKS